jgi:hypothetical protein
VISDSGEEVCELECAKCLTVWQLPLEASASLEASTGTLAAVVPAAAKIDRDLRHAAVRKVLQASWAAEDAHYPEASRLLKAAAWNVLDMAQPDDDALRHLTSGIAAANHGYGFPVEVAAAITALVRQGERLSHMPAR